ncbi:hypothetical protein DV701_04790 [Ornithinimicrobium avium]|uniref:TIGR03086 family protein n=1 Tax=Ornithinimicrobium avium TaxID=2283195 RepID=A0A345NKH8_9MICO|nr:hypothetical protein DV701_04790 [Ornithinimicrobium avium]
MDAVLLMRAGDVALHAWDVASAAGQPWPVDEDLAGWLLEAAAPVIEELRQLGFFAAPLPAAGGSNRERLLALAGRRSTAS